MRDLYRFVFHSKPHGCTWPCPPSPLPLLLILMWISVVELPSSERAAPKYSSDLRLRAGHPRSIYYLWFYPQAKSFGVHSTIKTLKKLKRHTDCTFPKLSLFLCFPFFHSVCVSPFEIACPLRRKSTEHLVLPVSHLHFTCMFWFLLQLIQCVCILTINLKVVNA